MAKKKSKFWIFLIIFIIFLIILTVSIFWLRNRVPTGFLAESVKFIKYDDFSGVGQDYQVDYTNLLVVKDATKCQENTCNGNYKETDQYGCVIWDKTVSEKVSGCQGDCSSRCQGCTSGSRTVQWCGHSVGCYDWSCVGGWIPPTFDTYTNCYYSCGGASFIPHDLEMGVDSSEFTSLNENELILPDNVKMVYMYPKAVETIQINGVSKSIIIDGGQICYSRFGCREAFGHNVVTYKLFDYKDLDNSLLHYGKNTIVSNEQLELIIQYGKCRGTWESSCGSVYPVEIPKGRDTWWCPSSYDRVTTCDFEKWINIPSEGQASNTILNFVSRGKSTRSGLSTKDFKTYDLYLLYEGSASLSLVILEDNDLVKQKVINTYPISNMFTESRKHNLKIIHSSLDPTKLYVENDGFNITTLNIPELRNVDNSIHLQISPNIDWIGYRNFMSCQYTSDEVTIKQKFSKGSRIYIEDPLAFKYRVHKFCWNKEAQFIKIGVGSTSDINSEIYQKLIAGETLTVGDDTFNSDAWELFYITGRTGTEIPPCPIADQAWDVDLQECVIVGAPLISLSELEALKRRLQELEVSTEEKARLINELELTLTEQTEVLDSLNILIEEKAQIINQMKLTLAEQAAIISNLELSVEEQGQLITSLEINLQEKAFLVSQLEITNEEQAELIEAMELSFSDQAEIITALKGEIEDDATIISNLYTSLDDQANLITELEYTNEQLSNLIIEFNLTIDQQAELISNLKLSVEEEKELISLLHSEIEKQQELLKLIKEQIGIPILVWIIGILFIIVVFSVILIIASKKRRK